MKFGICFFFVFCFQAVFSASTILIPMTDKLTYDYLDYLNISGRINIPFTGSKPYRSDEIYKKLTEISELLLENIDEETVDFKSTYDGDLQEPLVFPAKFPNLLANGASGIAVGMATMLKSDLMRLSESTSLSVTVVGWGRML